jgi:hypothetical protein
MIFPEINFKTEEEFRKTLSEHINDKSKVEGIVNHEKEHFEKARELGYNPEYVIIVLNPWEIIPGVRIYASAKGFVKPIDHYRILRATKTPSKGDLETMRRLEEGLEF